MIAENLKDYIAAHYGTQADFARANDVKPQQVTKWLAADCVVINDHLYTQQRALAFSNCCEHPVTVSEHVDICHGGNQAACARANDTTAITVGRWIKKHFVVIGDQLYSPRYRGQLIPTKHTEAAK